MPKRSRRIAGCLLIAAMLSSACQSRRTIVASPVPDASVAVKPTSSPLPPSRTAVETTVPNNATAPPVKNRALGYTFDRGQGQLIDALCMDVSLKYAAGGLYSTVGDLYKWDQALTTDRLVSAETLGPMFTSTVSIPYPLGAVYGYGWTISQPSGYRVIEHDGKVPGFASDLARYPEKQAAIVVLSNVDTSDPSHIREVLAATLFGE